MNTFIEMHRNVWKLIIQLHKTFKYKMTLKHFNVSLVMQHHFISYLVMRKLKILNDHLAKNQDWLIMNRSLFYMYECDIDLFPVLLFGNEPIGPSHTTAWEILYELIALNGSPIPLSSLWKALFSTWQPDNEAGQQLMQRIL